MKKISLHKNYETKDGRSVRLLCVDGPSDYPVVGIVSDEVHTWREDGSYLSKGEDEIDDLVEVQPKLSGYVSILEGSQGNKYAIIHGTLESAIHHRKNSSNLCVACIDLSQFKKGEGL